MTRITLALAAMLPMLATGPAQAQGIAGIFQTQANDDGNIGMVQFGPCANGFCGTLIKSFDAQGRELATDKLGTVMVQGMQDQGGGRFGGGTILDPGSGKTYRSQMALEGLVLAVKGCVAVFCKTQTWTRAD